MSFLVLRGWPASDVASLVGVRVGASQKQQANAAATKTQDLVTRALTALSPDKLAEIMNK